MAFTVEWAAAYRQVVEHAIQIVFLHLTWLFKKFSEDDVADEDKVEDLKAKRDRAKDSFEKLAMRDQVNPVESVTKQVSS